MFFLLLFLASIPGQASSSNYLSQVEHLEHGYYARNHSHEKKFDRLFEELKIQAQALDHHVTAQDLEDDVVGYELVADELCSALISTSDADSDMEAALKKIANAVRKRLRPADFK